MLLALPVYFLVTQPILLPAPVSGLDITLPDRLKLGRHIHALSGPLSPHSWKEKIALEDVAGYIATEWERAGMDPQQQLVQTKQGEFKNIFVNLGPSTNEVVILGARYDDTGLEDNSGAVSVLIEVAKILHRSELKRRVIVIALFQGDPTHFTGAETGSSAHARAMKSEGNIVKAMLSMDKIGFRLRDSSANPDAGNYILVASNLGNLGLTRKTKTSMRAASPIAVLSMNLPGFTPGGSSGHEFYWQEGFPALLVTDTAFYRNKTDAQGPVKGTEQMDTSRMAYVLAGISRAVVDLANEE